MQNHYETVEDYIWDVGKIMPESDAVQLADGHGLSINDYYNDHWNEVGIDTDHFMAWLGY